MLPNIGPVHLHICCQHDSKHQKTILSIFYGDTTESSLGVKIKYLKLIPKNG